jgi:hypothetical protein
VPPKKAQNVFCLQWSGQEGLKKRSPLVASVDGPPPKILQKLRGNNRKTMREAEGGAKNQKTIQPELFFHSSLLPSASRIAFQATHLCAGAS